MTQQVHVAGGEQPVSLPMVLKFAFPIVMGNVSAITMRFIDTIIVSRWDKNALAAINPSHLIFFIFSFFFMGIIRFTNALTAQYYGAGQEKKCGIVIWQSLYVAAAAYAVILLTTPLVPGVIGFFRHDPSIRDMEYLFYRIVSKGSILMMGAQVLSMFAAGIGRTRIVMWSNLAGVIVNIPLTWLLVFGNETLGIPQWGIQGAAYAIILSDGIILASLVIFILRRDIRTTYGTTRSIRFDKTVMLKLLRFGIPSGLASLAALAFVFFFMAIGKLGVDVQAAANIISNWKNLVFLPMAGLGTATASLVARYSSARKFDHATGCVSISLKIATVYAGIMIVLCLVIPDLMVSLFQSRKPGQDFTVVTHYAVNLLRLSSLLFLFDAYAAVLIGALQGAGDTRFTMIASNLLHWIVLAVPAWFLIYRFEASVYSLWLCFIIFVMIFAGVLYLRFRQGRWKTIRVIEPQETAEMAGAMLQAQARE